ncbi:MAG TPA: response regulator [Elusimicrobiota bacterium]|nr:response regulator [Elusimicrobiota bacterium]
MTYYLYDGTKSVGPFAAADLLKQPGFGPATLVAPVGATAADAWKPAGSVPEIAALLKPAAPPPPPPPAAKPAPGPAEITLTFAPPKPKAPEPEPAPAPAAAPAPVPVPAPVDEFAPKFASPSEKLVLVVDDDESVRSLIEMTAMTQGFQVLTAENGNDAMTKLASRTPDLIVTDLMMPGQSGYEFLRSLQAAGSGRIPVFVVTGSALDTSTVGVIKQEGNVVEFFSKPIAMAKFTAAMHKHLKTAPK